MQTEAAPGRPAPDPTGPLSALSDSSIGFSRELACSSATFLVYLLEAESDGLSFNQISSSKTLPAYLRQRLSCPPAPPYMLA